LNKLKNEPAMRGLGGGGEGTAQGREGVAVGEGIRLSQVGGRDAVQEDLMDEGRVTVGLKRQVNDIHEQCSTKSLARVLRHTVDMGTVMLRPRGALIKGVVCILAVVPEALGIQVCLQEIWVYIIFSHWASEA
jgi:hypothetical protein